MSAVVYCYDQFSLVFVGTEPAILDPLTTQIKGEEVYFESANSTLIPIPEFSGTTIPQFDKEKKEWKIINDFRNCIITDKITKDEFICNTVGDLPENFTLKIIEKDKALVKWDEEKNDWTYDIEKVKEKDKSKRNAYLYASDAKIIRYNSENFLIEKGIINKTTNSEEEILQWEIYRQLLRDFMKNWYQEKEFPKAPNIK